MESSASEELQNLGDNCVCKKPAAIIEPVGLESGYVTAKARLPAGRLWPPKLT